ncbi:MAG: hypothetical protein ACR2NX_09905 [Chthoniobacterales bacterium]
MPLSTETTKDCLGIVHRGTGVITGEEFVEASHSALQLIENTQNFQYEFLDLSEATGLREMGESHLDQLTHQDRLAAIYRPNAVVVIVAPQDDLYEMGKKWERRVVDLGWSTHVSRERTEALVWLSENFPPPAAKLEGQISSPSAIKATE